MLRRKKKNPLNTISYYTEFLNDIHNLFKLIQCCQWRYKTSKLSKTFIYSPVISNEVIIETYWIISRYVLRQCDMCIYKSAGSCSNFHVQMPALFSCWTDSIKTSLLCRYCWAWKAKYADYRNLSKYVYIYITLLGWIRYLGFSRQLWNMWCKF